MLIIKDSLPRVTYFTFAIGYQSASFLLVSFSSIANYILPYSNHHDWYDYIAAIISMTIWTTMTIGYYVVYYAHKKQYIMTWDRVLQDARGLRYM